MESVIHRGETEKVLYLMRGLPGSGKTTLARTLSNNIFATDDFFLHEGKYVFVLEKADEAHEWNRRRVREALASGVSPVVVDNTNIRAWELKPYVEMGMIFGYDTVLVEPESPHKWDVEELARKSQHGVPKEVIEKMLELYEKDLTLDLILKSSKP